MALRALGRLSSGVARQPFAAVSRGLSSDTATFETKPCLGHKIDIPDTTVTATKDECFEYLESMMTIRRMETTAGELYRAKKIRGFCHLYSGQEACAVGMTAAMDPEDGICNAYRVHGWAYCKGVSVKGVIGELLGNSSGCSNGKGGSMHMYTPTLFGGNGIVGAQVPLGAGIALAHQYNGKPLISVSLYGDGASNQGQVFEAYNIAKLWKLPAIFVCENNKYGMGTSAERSSASTDYYTRGDYIPGLKVDAMDVLCVKNATAYAREYALNEGPIVMEMETYRYHGHSMSDPDTTYRSRDDIAEMRKNYDPILSLRAKMIEAGWTTEEEVKALEKQIRKQVAKEVAEAEAAGPTGQDQLLAHIYQDGADSANLRGCDVTIRG
mmetsp:Transcript_21142/g.55011  ORF Transcript_21142/g.55011 Transcript_21142/m.55011 type:complete len:382 (+) Transcript_21142:42-1187(+)